MSHGDQLSEMPPNFHVIGKTRTAPYAALAHNAKPFYGIQFHPEVTHSPMGKAIIGRFILNICGCKPVWTMVSNSNQYCRTFLKRYHVLSLGRIYWQGDQTNTRDGRAEGTSYRCC